MSPCVSSFILRVSTLTQKLYWFLLSAGLWARQVIEYESCPFRQPFVWHTVINLKQQRCNHTHQYNNNNNNNGEYFWRPIFDELKVLTKSTGLRSWGAGNKVKYTHSYTTVLSCILYKHSRHSYKTFLLQILAPRGTAISLLFTNEEQKLVGTWCIQYFCHTIWPCLIIIISYLWHPIL